MKPRNDIDRVIIKKPADIIPVVKRYAKRRQENFLAITLDGAHRVIKLHHISKGLVNKTIVHPRECYYPAIKDNASAIVFAHNHPSGQLDISPEDMEITKRLCMAGKILGFHVVDHIIFTKNHERYRSFREYGKFSSCEYFEQKELDQFVAELSYPQIK